MPDKLTDKEIVKALEDLVKCNNNEIDCGSCSLSVFYPRCPEEVGELALDLINRLQAQVKKCEKVEHFADKTIATLQAENKRLKAPTTDWLVRGISPEQLEKEKIQAFTEEINRLQAENERLKPFEDKIAKFNSHIRVEDMLVFASSLEEWLEFCENLKSETYKEFVDRLKEQMYQSSDWSHGEHPFVVEESDIDNTLYELVGEDNG